MLDIRTERNGTLGLLAVFRMIAAEGDQLLANGAPAVRLAFTDFGMRDDAFHLVTAGQAAIRVTTLTRVYQ